MNKEREQIIVVRKKKAGHGHHGGAWKVAFADFMTAMFAMFLVLWIVGQSSDVRVAIAGYFQDPLGRGKEYGASIIPGAGAQAALPTPVSQTQVTNLLRQRLEQLGERIRARIGERPEFDELAKHLEIEVTNEGLRLQLLEDSTGVFFETGSAQPRPQVREFLAQLGTELAALPNEVVVDGYTDARPYSPNAAYSNWELSADRANVTRRILVAGGLPDRQLRQVRGHADRDLRRPEDPHSPSNRRVTITMLFDSDDGTIGAPVPLPGPPQPLRDTLAAHLSGPLP